MPTDFKYVPTSGNLPGKSFEEQTQQALNELGGSIEDGNETAEEAKQIAQSAKDTASQALQTVQTAVDAANIAVLSAQNAISTANSANLAANNALAGATEAKTTANLATTTANSALDTALTAKTAAETALNTVGNLESDIQSAQETATIALNIAGMAQGVYINVPTATSDGLNNPTIIQFDANDYISSAQKFYVIPAPDTTLPQVPLNFPSELIPPIYFLIEVNSDSTSVSQSAWDVGADRVYTRIGSTDYSDPENPVATWTPWNTIATPNVVENVEVIVDPDGQPSGTYLVITYGTTSGESESVYVNLSQMIGAGYSSGNGAIEITVDNKILVKIDPSDENLMIGPAGLKMIGQAGFNARQVITTSGAYIAPVTGWYRVTCIGGGGSGGAGGGSGSSSGGGGGGGGAGEVTWGYLYLTKDQGINATIGAVNGATSFSTLTALAGGAGGAGGAGSTAGGGAGGTGGYSGTGPGGTGIRGVSGTGTVGGSGGSGGGNGTSYGGGGGGAGGSGGGGAGGSGTGTPGSGAVILEYFNPETTA